MKNNKEMVKVALISLQYIYKFILVFVIVTLLNIGSKCQSLEPKVSYNKAYLYGKLVSDLAADSMSILLFPTIISEKNKFQTEFEKFTVKVNNGFFRIEIDGIKEPTYILLTIGKRRGLPLPILTNLFLISPGDSVCLKMKKRNVFPKMLVRTVSDDSLSTVCYNCFDYFFEGPGSAKYACMYKTIGNKDVFHEAWYEKHPELTWKNSASFIEKVEISFRRSNFLTKEPLKILNTFKSQMTEDEYQLIRADIAGYYGATFFTLLPYFIASKLNKDEKNELVSLYKKNYVDYIKKISRIRLAKSAYYANLIIEKERFEQKIDNGKVNEIYNALKSKYTGILRERLLAHYFMEENGIKNVDSLLTDAITIVKEQKYLKNISEKLNSQSVGKPAYNFSLEDHNNKTYKLSDFKGKFVFIDFWFTGCGACMDFYKNVLSKVESKFENNNEIIFISISVDGDKNKWMKSISMGGYTSKKVVNLLADISNPVIKKMGVYGYPRPILIDKEGNILIKDESLRTSKFEELVVDITKILEKNNGSFTVK